MNINNQLLTGQNIKIEHKDLQDSDIDITGDKHRIELFDTEVKNLKIHKIYHSLDKLSHLQITLAAEKKIVNLQISKIINFEKILISGGAKEGYNFDLLKLDDVLIPSIEKGNYLLSNFRCKKILINDLTNLSNNFEIRDLFIEELEIKNSNLGSLKLNGITIGKLTLENVTLNDCIFNGVEFKDYKLGAIKKGDGDIDYKKLKDNYRQLKHVMEKNGNYTEANKFYEREIQFYKKNINYQYKGLKKLTMDLSNENFQGEKTKAIGELITIGSSNFINGLGTNWLRAGQLIILLVFIATFLDGASYILSSLGLGNLLSDLIIMLMCFLIILTDEYFNKILLFNKVGKFFNSVLNNFFIFILVCLFITLLISIIPSDTSYFGGLKEFAKYLSPIYFLPDYIVENGRRVYIEYNGIELLSFVIFKILYSILLWHLIVAAKRTTKR